MNVKKSTSGKAMYFPEISQAKFEQLIKKAGLNTTSNSQRMTIQDAMPGISSLQTIYESEIPFQPFYVNSTGNYLPIEKFMNDSKKAVRIAIVPESDRESFILPNSNGTINPNTRLIFVANSNYLRIEYPGKLKELDLDKLDPSKYQLTREPTKGFAEAKYNFVGGTVVKGEDFRQAAIRELYEETGINVNKDDPNFVLLSSMATVDRSLKHNLFICFVSDEQINNLSPVENDVAAIYSAKISDLRELKNSPDFSAKNTFSVHLRVFIFGRSEKPATPTKSAQPVRSMTPTSSFFIRNPVRDLVRTPNINSKEIGGCPIKTRKFHHNIRNQNKDGDFLHHHIKDKSLIPNADRTKDWRINMVKIIVN